MAKKFDRRAVRTYHFDEMKWAVVRYFDGQLSGVLKGTEVEDEETGITLQEGYLQEGDYCMAKWLDKNMYQAKILFLGSDKTEAAKQVTLLKAAYLDKPAKEDKPEKRVGSGKDSEPKKRRQTNPDNELEPKKKEPKTAKAAEKKAQISAQEKMVEELLAVQYGRNEQVEEWKWSLEEKEQIIKEKDEELFAMSARLQEKEMVISSLDSRLKSRTIQPCPCNGALASLLRSEAVQQFVSQLAGLCPTPSTFTETKPSTSMAVPTPPAFSPSAFSSPKSRFTSPPPPPPPPPSPSPGSLRAVSPSTSAADLVDLGGGVTLKKIVIDACLSSAKGSTSKLVRNLLHAFFSDQELGESSAEGKGTKAALPTGIVTAIKGFVLSNNSKMTERELV